MKPFDYFVHLILSCILIVGAYQFYFFTQKHIWFKTREFKTFLDDKIPFIPWWSWIYSFLYYPAILAVNLVVENSRQFVMMAFTYILLLVMQMLFFVLIPVKTPDHWRKHKTEKTNSEKFLLFVQKFDDMTNCFPSMHVSVAMLTALLLYPAMGAWVMLFPLLIAISCVFTKQHYLIDTPAGALLGWVAHRVYLFMI
ncbi:MAG: phosphatase PAP2 family protein [Azoarcus sp.]|jgi:membrane-associated phospholipid phosphatase|nr:phosphatase PAP2 family protein [Azoarcus sp.]